MQQLTEPTNWPRQDDFPQFSELNAPPPQSDDPSYVNLEDFDAGQKCQVSDWGPWSDCSSSCDTGAQTRSVGSVNVALML